MTDLTFMEDGNPDNVVHNGVPMINYYKRELVYNTLREIRMYQQSSYKYSAASLINYLFNQPQHYQLPGGGAHPHLLDSIAI